jgi:hypothetical protein
MKAMAMRAVRFTATLVAAIAMLAAWAAFTNWSCGPGLNSCPELKASLNRAY